MAALQAIDGTLVASAHQSHAYSDGACLYFTFAGRRPGADTRQRGGNGQLASDTWAETYYRFAWDAVMDAVMAAGGAISHHHGIGINRSALHGTAPSGGSLDVLAAIKDALDPRGILNPGKLGLPVAVRRTRLALNGER